MIFFGNKLIIFFVRIVMFFMYFFFEMECVFVGVDVIVYRVIKKFIRNKKKINKINGV